MAADPCKILVSVTPETLLLLDLIAAEDAQRLDRRLDRSASIRDLVRAEDKRREKSRQNYPKRA